MRWASESGHTSLVFVMGAFRSKPQLTDHGLMMRRMADVELQSCMHFLSSRDLIRFARCNRRLRSLAKAKFAWAHTWMHLDVSSHKPEQAFVQRLQLYPLIAISWLGAEISHGGLVAWLDALGNRVRLLHVASIGASRGPQVWLLKHPSLLTLEELIVQDPILCTTQLIEAIAALPKLRRLDITPLANHDTESVFAPLANAPMLTSLSIADSEPGKPTLLRRIAACASLVRLRLTYPQLYGDEFVSFFSSVHMRCLQSLSLHRFHLRAHGAARKTTHLEMRAAFEGMRFLHTLSLSLCNNVDVLVSQLRWFPRLELLKIQSAKAQSTAPSVPALAALLEATDTLRCCLHYLSTYDLGSLQQPAINEHRDRFTKDQRLEKFQSRIRVAQSDEFE